MEELPIRKTEKMCEMDFCNTRTFQWRSCSGCKKKLCAKHVGYFNEMVYDFNNNHRVKGYYCSKCYITRLF